MIEIDRKRCVRCGTCVGVCAPDAVFIEGDELRIDYERCIMCLDCAEVCPVGALTEAA